MALEIGEKKYKTLQNKIDNMNNHTINWAMPVRGTNRKNNGVTGVNGVKTGWFAIIYFSQQDCTLFNQCKSRHH